MLRASIRNMLEGDGDYAWRSNCSSTIVGLPAFSAFSITLCRYMFATLMDRARSRQRFGMNLYALPFRETRVTALSNVTASAEKYTLSLQAALQNVRSRR